MFESGKRVRFGPGDALIVCLVLTAALLSFMAVNRINSDAAPTTLIVEVNGKVVETLELGRGLQRTITVNGWTGKSVAVVQGARVRMLSSSCRDKICIGMGWAQRSGSSIVCLPNRVVLRIARNRTSRKVDAITE